MTTWMLDGYWLHDVEILCATVRMLDDLETNDTTLLPNRRRQMMPPYYRHARQVKVIEISSDKEMDDAEFEVEFECVEPEVEARGVILHVEAKGVIPEVEVEGVIPEVKAEGDEPKVEIIKISSDEEIEGVVKDVALKVELEDSNIEEDLKEDPDQVDEYPEEAPNDDLLEGSIQMMLGLGDQVPHPSQILMCNNKYKLLIF